MTRIAAHSPRGGGHLDVSKWLQNYGCLWDDETCALAARVGSWRC
jgi:hypothetical protein